MRIRITSSTFYAPTHFLSLFGLRLSSACPVAINCKKQRSARILFESVSRMADRLTDARQGSNSRAHNPLDALMRMRIYVPHGH